MNYLTNPKLLQDALSHISETVLVNDEPQQAVITMAYLGEHERRHISSNQLLKTGDYIKHKDVTYIIAQEVETTRHFKYRSAIELCNITFVFEGEEQEIFTGEFDWQGKPIYEIIPGEDIPVPAFAESLSEKISYEAWGVKQNTIVASIQQNETTEENIKVNDELEVRGRKYAVTHIDRLVTGVLRLTLEFQLSS